MDQMASGFHSQPSFKYDEKSRLSYLAAFCAFEASDPPKSERTPTDPSATVPAFEGSHFHPQIRIQEAVARSMMRNQPLLHSLLLIAAAIRCHAQASDPCPVERAEFTGNTPLSSRETLAATLDNRKLGTSNIFEFPTDTALALSISTEDSSPISSLLVGMSRSDDGANADFVPCDSLASGITFAPNIPQESMTAFISVEDSNSHVILDVTIVLEDGTFLYGIYSVEFVDSIYRFPSASPPPPSPMPVTVIRGNRQNDYTTSYTGESGKGKSGSGKGESGFGTSGKGTSGKSTSGKGISGKSTSGKSTSGKSTSGKSTSGKSTSGRSTSGKSTSGWSASGKGTSGKGTSGESLYSSSRSSSKGTSLGKGHSST